MAMSERRPYTPEENREMKQDLTSLVADNQSDLIKRATRLIDPGKDHPRLAFTIATFDIALPQERTNSKKSLQKRKKTLRRLIQKSLADYQISQEDSRASQDRAENAAAAGIQAVQEAVGNRPDFNFNTLATFQGVTSQTRLPGYLQTHEDSAARRMLNLIRFSALNLETIADSASLSHLITDPIKRQLVVFASAVAMAQVFFDKQEQSEGRLTKLQRRDLILDYAINIYNSSGHEMPINFLLYQKTFQQRAFPSIS